MLRLFSRLLVSFALTFAAFALTAHVLSLVAFDPGRPERVAAAMLGTEQGQALAAEAISAQLQTLVPGMDPAQADALALQVAQDPNLPQALEDAGSSHQPHAVASALVAALARANPQLGRAAHGQLARSAGNDVGHGGGVENLSAGAWVPDVFGSRAATVRERVSQVAVCGWCWTGCPAATHSRTRSCRRRGCSVD